MHDWEYLNSSFSIETPDQREIEEWLNSDEPAYKALTDDELIQTVSAVENEEDDDEEDNADTPACSRKINHSEAVDAFETALRYAEQQTFTKPVDIIFLKKWRDYASMKRRSCVKQTKIDSFW